ncbi:MAG: hypothetical protein NXY57DRAFT_907245, partial [Lentinula lateritia]
SSRTVRALIVPSLCYPMVLGIPFLAHNFLVTDYAARTVMDKTTGFDLMNPSRPYPLLPFLSPKECRNESLVTHEQLFEQKKSVILELRAYFRDHPRLLLSDPVLPIDVAAAVRSRIEHLSVLDSLWSNSPIELTIFFSRLPSTKSGSYCAATMGERFSKVKCEHRTRSTSAPADRRHSR